MSASAHLAFSPSIRRWRLIESGPMPGAENMACDIALLEGILADLDAGRQPVPVLRLYSWQPAAVSLGYHQRADGLDLARLDSEGIDVVRRPTGGRAIYHLDELTYAVVGPLSLFSEGIGVMASYRAVSSALLGGLNRALGIEAHLASLAGKGSPDSRSPVACFARPAACDAVAKGKKVVGSAQVRKRGAFLQHGSIPLRPREEEERRVLLGGGGARIEALGSLAEAAGRDVTWREAAAAVVWGFEELALVQFEPGELCDRERKVMDSIVQNVRVTRTCRVAGAV